MLFLKPEDQDQSRVTMKMTSQTKMTKEKKVILTSCLLFFVPVSSLLYNAIDDVSMYYFPLIDGYSKRLDWVVSLGADRLCAVIYVLCLIIRPDFKKVLNINLWWFYFLYELFRFSDHLLTYESMPFREYFAYFLVIYQLFYCIIYLLDND